MAEYKGRVYKITNNLTGDFYIGSTKHKILKRWIEHKYNSTNPERRSYNCKLYQNYREHGIDNFRIEKIEKLNVKNKDELHEREQHYISLFKPTLNTQRAFTTEETRKETLRKYLEKNKEKIYEGNKKRCARFKEKNEQHIKDYKAEWYRKRKEQGLIRKRPKEKNDITLEKRKNEKVECECGAIVRKDGFKKHNLTKKHLDNL